MLGAANTSAPGLSTTCLAGLILKGNQTYSEEDRLGNRLRMIYRVGLFCVKAEFDWRSLNWGCLQDRADLSALRFLRCEAPAPTDLPYRSEFLRAHLLEKHKNLCFKSRVEHTTTPLIS